MTETASKLTPEMLDGLLKGVKTEQELNGVQNWVNNLSTTLWTPKCPGT